MKSLQLSRRRVYFAITLVVILLDQLTKYLVVSHLPLHTGFNVIPGFFDILHVQNTGAAFSLFANLPEAWRAFFLTGVAFVVFLFVLTYALKARVSDARLQTGLALIQGGALGNLIDRVRQGAVTDFLEVYVGTHHWPTFNVADSGITVGVLILAWDIWKHSPEKDDVNTTAIRKQA